MTQYPFMELILRFFVSCEELLVKLCYKHPACFALWYEIVKPNHLRGIIGKASLNDEWKFICSRDSGSSAKRDYIIGTIKGFVVILLFLVLAIYLNILVRS